MADQSLILFDDWNCFNADSEKGQRKAFREFLTHNDHFTVRELFSYGQYGQVFIVENSRDLAGRAGTIKLEPLS